jgi:hypothetical protein
MGLMIFWRGMEQGWEHFLSVQPTIRNGADVGITIWVPDIAIPGTDYEDGLAQGLNKLNPQKISTWITRKKTPIRIILGLL